MKLCQAMLQTALVMGTLSVVVPGRPASAQQPNLPGIGSTISHAPSRRDSMDGPETAPEVQAHLEKSRQTERQRKMIADTERLLALATELKADMDKTTKDTLSIEVIKKAEEIEKLAHSVKERMKG